MSSLSRGATGASKPNKPINVNQIYSGKNLNAGARPLGKHGLQPVGKSVGVVRRMPPPCTLPSLKAENNGQDPTIAVVPTGGTGWKQNDAAPAPAAPEPPKAVSSYTSSHGPDLRPSWAKPQAATEAPAPAAPSGEYPSLAAAAQGKDVVLKPQNKWATGTLPHQASSRSSTHTGSSFEEERQLPTRYYEGQPKQAYKSRFQGSNDARLSQPNYYMGNRTMSGSDNGRDYESDNHSRSDEVNRDGDSREKTDKSTSGFFDDSYEAHPQTDEGWGDGYPDEQYRQAAIDRSRQKRVSNRTSVSQDEAASEDVERANSHESHASAAAPQRAAVAPTQAVHHNGGEAAAPRSWGPPTHQEAPPKRHEERSAPVPEYRLLKRPERMELVDVSDDDEDIQMTKLNKPTVRVVKRVAGKEPEASPAPQAPVQQKVEEESRPIEREPVVPKRETAPRYQRVRDVPQVQKSAETKVEEPPAPPAENIWEKRKEERESLEKDKKASHVPKDMQQAIAQHFPSVAEAATIKVDKESTRKQADPEFTRAAMRARRQQTSNDVRQQMPHRGGDDDGGQTGGYERRQVVREPRGSGQQQQHYDGGDYEQQQRRPPQQQQPRPPRGGYRDRGDADYERGAGGEEEMEQRERYNRDRRHNYQNEQRGDYGDEDGGRRVYTNTRGGMRTRGIPTRGRGLRGSYSRGGHTDRMSHSAHHDSSYPRYQIQKRPTPLERDESTEDREEDVSAADEVVIATETPVVAAEESVDQQRESLNNNDSTSKSFEQRGEHSSDRGSGRRGQPYGPRRGRGQGYAPRERGGQLEEFRPPRRHRAHDEDVDEAGHPSQARTVRSSHGQRGARRGFNKEAPPRYSNKQNRQRRTSDDRNSQGKRSSNNAERLKSPVVSSEGHDEWETASETSNREIATRDERQVRGGSQKKWRSPSRQAQGDSAMPSSQQQPPRDSRIRSKNGQPASRTCRSPSDNGNNNAPRKESTKQRTTRPRSAERVGTSDGLAGLDINDFAKVVVIDEHFAENVEGCAGDFEEVLNKKQKRQKAQEMEIEEKRKQKEKERLEKAAARRAAKKNEIAAKKEAKKQQKEKEAEAVKEAKTIAPVEKVRVVASDKPIPVVVQQKEPECAQKKEVPVTTVWNSAHVAQMEKDMREHDAPAVIPSPIARPTPRSKSSASDSPVPAKSAAAAEEKQPRMVQLPVSVSSSQPLRSAAASDSKYDFTFDPHLHEAQMRESAERNHTTMSTGANSESGSVMADDVRLKENLNRVKDIWELENSTLPSNVAKVKPQPQTGAEPIPGDAKAEVANNAQQQINNAHSSGLAPFSVPLGGLSVFPNYPMMLNADAASYMPSGLVPPPNATSPPTNGMPFMPQSMAPHSIVAPQPQQARPQQQGQPQQRMNSYVDQSNGVFPNSRHQPNTWAPNNGGNVDGMGGMVSFGGNVRGGPPQQSASNTSANNYGSFFNAPMRQPGNVSQSRFVPPGGQKMAGNMHGGPPPPPPPGQMMYAPMEMLNMPPPPSSHGPVGGHRDRHHAPPQQGQFAPPPPQHHMPPHHHHMPPQPPHFMPPNGNNNFIPQQPMYNQPPPVRFNQPPPAMGVPMDMSWTKNLPQPHRAHPQQFGSFNNGGSSIGANDWQYGHKNMGGAQQPQQHYPQQQHSGSRASSGMGKMSRTPAGSERHVPSPDDTQHMKMQQQQHGGDSGRASRQNGGPPTA